MGASDSGAAGSASFGLSARFKLFFESAYLHVCMFAYICVAKLDHSCKRIGGGRLFFCSRRQLERPWLQASIPVSSQPFLYCEVGKGGSSVRLYRSAFLECQ